MKNYFGVTIFFVICMSYLLDATDSKPTVSRVRGNQYTPGVLDTQVAGLVGQLVPTGIFGMNGILNLSDQVSQAQAVATQVLDTGIIVVLLSDGSNSYLAEYTPQGEIYSQFAQLTNNIVTLSGLADPCDGIFIDEQQRILIAGQNDTNGYPWIRRINSDGTIDTNFNFSAGSIWGLDGQINRLGILTTGQIIAVGFNGNYAMIGLYNIDGSVATNFGTDGYVIFNGNNAYPTSLDPLRTVVIDMYNNLYLAYTTINPSVYVTRLMSNGSIDLGWNGGLPVSISYLDGMAMVVNQLCMAINSRGDLIVAVPSGSDPTVIKAASITSTDGTQGSFANFITSGGVFDDNSFSLSHILTTSDNQVYFVGANLTYVQMAIICLTNFGILNTEFNSKNTPGVNFFWTPSGMPPVQGILTSMSLAPDGQIFSAGFTLNAGVTTPYLSCLYGNQYVNQMPQFPQSQEQGTSDGLFGSLSTETNPGVVAPYVGLYRSSMQQKAETITELLSGKILMGSSGYVGSTNYTSMILVRLNSSGVLDNTFGSGGKLVLANADSPSIVSEYITNVLEDSVGNLYVSGYSSHGAIFRKYTEQGVLIWNADYQVSGFIGLSVGLDTDFRVVLFLSGPSGTGQINAYNESNGSFDITFANGGILVSSSLSLNMGPLYSGVIDDAGIIFIAYKNAVTNYVDAAAIDPSGLVTLWRK